MSLIAQKQESELITEDFTFTEAFNLELCHFRKKCHHLSKNRVLPVLLTLYHVCLLDEGIQVNN